MEKRSRRKRQADMRRDFAQRTAARAEERRLLRRLREAEEANKAPRDSSAKDKRNQRRRKTKRRGSTPKLDQKGRYRRTRKGGSAQTSKRTHFSSESSKQTKHHDNEGPCDDSQSALYSPTEHLMSRLGSVHKPFIVSSEIAAHIEEADLRAAMEMSLADASPPSGAQMPHGITTLSGTEETTKRPASAVNEPIEISDDEDQDEALAAAMKLSVIEASPQLGDFIDPDVKAELEKSTRKYRKKTQSIVFDEHFIEDEGDADYVGGDYVPIVLPRSYQGSGRRSNPPLAIIREPAKLSEQDILRMTIEKSMEEERKREIQAAQELRKEQDLEYERALKQDRKKEEQEKLAQLEAQMEQTLQTAKEEEAEKAKEIAKTYITQEPTEETAQDLDTKLFSVAFRLPDGSRIQRRFLGTDNLKMLHIFILSKDVVPEGSFELVTDFPRRNLDEIARSGASLIQDHLSQRDVVTVNPVS